MRFYRAMCRLPAPRSYLGKILLVSFLGVHVPMIVAVLYVLAAKGSSFTDSIDILLVLLLATLGGTIATLAALYALLAPVSAAASALRAYLEDRTIPALPTRFDDRAGRLMANVQEAVTRLDMTLDMAEAQRDEAIRVHRDKFELLASMSHDLRTPLNHMIGFAEMMSNEALGPLGSLKYRGYASTIGSSGGNLLGILQTVLDMSAAEAGRMDVDLVAADLGEAVSRAVNLVHHQAESSGVDVALDRDPQQTLTVRVDERNLKQMLLQTMQISIADPTHTSRVHVSVDGVAGLASVVVQSDAPWQDGDVPPELSPGPAAQIPDRQPVAEGFASSNPTALRLSLVESLAPMMGARFRVGSAQDGGRQMIIQLPLTNAAAMPTAA